MKKRKIRIDTLVAERGLVKSRERAKAMIMAGRVLVENTLVDKPGTQVDENVSIIVKADDNPFVSRGGLKLKKASEINNAEQIIPKRINALAVIRTCV